MATIEICRACERCNGTGEVILSLEGGSPETITCPDCEGVTTMLFAVSNNLDTRIATLETMLDIHDTKLNALDTKLDSIEIKIDALE